MTLSTTRPARLLRKVLFRAPLRLVPARARVPVLSGPLRGTSWIAGSGIPDCWLGTYERTKQTVLRALVAPGSVVYDVGAQAGFYTLLFARLVGERGMVVAFEPLPDNLAYLHRHVRMNGLRSVRVVEAAVAARDGEVRFRPGPNRYEGAISPDGGLPVRAVALDTLAGGAQLPPPDCIKIDVEGAELEVLRGAAAVLESARPTLLVATHGEGVHDACLEALGGHRYRVYQIGEERDELLALPRERRAALSGLPLTPVLG